MQDGVLRILLPRVEGADLSPYAAALTAAGAAWAYATDDPLTFDGLLLTPAADEETAKMLGMRFADHALPIFALGSAALWLNEIFGGRRGDGKPGVIGRHTLHTRADSLFYDLYDTEFSSPFATRPGIAACGWGICPAAWGEDGVTEGFVHTALPVFGALFSLPLQGEGGYAPGLPLYRYFLCLCREKSGRMYPAYRRDPDVRFALGMLDEEEDV